jgi:hypothetical protein
MNNTATINGLVDGISVLENDDKNQQPSYQSDILYNDKEPADLNLDELYYNDDYKISQYHEEGYTIPEYRTEDFGETVTLLNTITMEEAILGKSVDIIQT